MTDKLTHSKFGTNPMSGIFLVWGTRNTIKLCREAASREPIIKRFLKVWDDAPHEMKRASKVERLCEENNLATDELRAEIVKLSKAYAKDLAKMKQAKALVRLMDVSTNAASDKENFEERRIHLQEGGVAPIPSSGVNVTQQQLTLNASPTPSMENTVLNLERLLRGEQPVIEGQIVRELEAGSPT